MMLDKTQIRRILKDHCQEQIRKDDVDSAIDIIAQTLIEHENEVVKPFIGLYTLQAFLEKLNAKEPKTKIPLFKAIEICKFALNRSKYKQGEINYATHRQ